MNYGITFIKLIYIIKLYSFKRDVNLTVRLGEKFRENKWETISKIVGNMCQH